MPPLAVPEPALPTRIVLTGLGAAPLGQRLGMWARRTVTIPCLLVIGALLLVGSPVLLGGGLLADGVLRRRFAVTRALICVMFVCACEIAGVVAAAWLWLRHLGRKNRELFLAQNFALQCWWTGTLLRGAFRVFSLRAEIEGAEHAEGGPLVAMFRHASVADTLLPMMLIASPHGIRLRWVLKRELLWDPCLDIVGNRLRNCFVSRMPETNARDVAAVGSLMDGLGPTDGIALYPEGTRFSRSKRRRLIDKFGDRAAAYQNVLPPRLGGALALLDHNAAGADVLFCAHTGLEPFTRLSDVFGGGAIGNTIHIKLWRVAHADIPLTRDERIAWLHAEWAKVDEFVSAHLR